LAFAARVVCLCAQGLQKLYDRKTTGAERVPESPDDGALAANYFLYRAVTRR